MSERKYSDGIEKPLEMSRNNRDHLIIETNGIDGVTVHITGSMVHLIDFEDDMVFLGRNNATEIAKAILQYYKVPFCNRVEGAGVKE